MSKSESNSATLPAQERSTTFLYGTAHDGEERSLLAKFGSAERNKEHASEEYDQERCIGVEASRHVPIFLRKKSLYTVPPIQFPSCDPSNDLWAMSIFRV